MFQDDIFDEWLDSESRSLLEKFKSNQPLSVEDKMILTLKAQTNHFAHLDIEIRNEIKEMGINSNKCFEQIDRRFEKMNTEIKNIYKAINNQTWKMLGGIGLIVIFGKIIDDLPPLLT